MPRKHVEGTEVQPNSINEIILIIGTFWQQQEHIKKGISDFLAYRTYEMPSCNKKKRST
jgi:hypothetical protein